MTDSRLLLRQRQDYLKLEKQALQLEQICMTQRALLEELCSVACAWAFDYARGVPELTDEEKRKIIEERK